jgi:hypothetical protein
MSVCLSRFKSLYNFDLEAHFFAIMTLDATVATVTLDTAFASGTTLTYVMFMVALLTSWPKEQFWV